ncbi:MAG: multicopper oxidase family protein [Spirulina sp. SIO3F2]|nr:multicopper oxidase family protein [Spirulina sp. SIO3F2]
MHRRNFLLLSIGAASAAALTQCATSQPSTVQSSATSPQIYRSQAGQLSLDLVAQAQTVQLGDRRANLLTYNGQVPGPRLEVRPGDRVQIHFTNQLKQPTNLHYHGLHIPQDGTADNVFLQVHPGERYTYQFEIPANHPAGTFWYHPHVHGQVAKQLFGGLAGLLVVRGELDEISEIQAAQEEFLVFKDFALGAQGNIPAPGHMAYMTGRVGDLLTTNGQLNPQFTLAQGGLLRLRLLNASVSRFLRLSLEAHSFYLMATDGGAIAHPVELETLDLAPGERTEVLIQGIHASGQYRLLNTPFNPAQSMGMGRMHGGSRNARTETVATVRYSGSRSPLAMPEQLIPVELLPEPQITRQFTLNHGAGMVFLINGQAFDPDRVDTTVQLNTTEDWLIQNTGMMAHPFHVHVNKFQVMSRNGQPMPYLAWKDVVSIQPGEQVRLRMQFKDFSGKTVYHCHVLDHEDRGMMGILDIQSADSI